MISGKDMGDSPFHNRPEEWDLYNPLVGSSMLELGNKKNGDLVYKTFFRAIGFKHTSIDMNGLDGALKMDLREPLNLGTFDMVTNIGTSEHVSENDFEGQIACWKNIVDACGEGTVLICGTPAPGAWRHHGTWYPYPVFYEEIALLNGFEIEKIYEIRQGTNRAAVMARLVRKDLSPFAMPGIGIYKNVR
jgi:hypothetical protein